MNYEQQLAALMAQNQPQMIVQGQPMQRPGLMQQPMQQLVPNSPYAMTSPGGQNPAFSQRGMELAAQQRYGMNNDFGPQGMDLNQWLAMGS